ncbi:MAG: SurA N-terminal domain-containing protein [Alistipes sp.]|nr:SurA N-terminal domain-containing protein [Alistipes sp.]
MISLNTLRTQFGVLLSVVIGGALIAFIFSLKTEMGFSGNDPEVGEIDGEEVAYSEFLAAYEDVKTQMGGDNFDYNQSAQAVANTWQSLVADRVFMPDFEALGLVVSEAERQAMLQGVIPSGVYGSVFADPRTGEYSLAIAADFLAQAEGNPQVARVWNLIDKQARIERAMAKYMDLVKNGAYANALTLNKGIVAANNTYKGKFVACKYSKVADSLVVVSKGDIKKYYNEHKSQYKQTPYRTVSYATFDVEPTEEDKKAIEEEVKKTSAEFAKAKDVKNFSRENRHASVAPTFVAAKSLSTDESKALAAGRTYGPELQGEEWYASRVVETRNVPDSLELQHIVLSYTDTEKAEKVFQDAKKVGADFAALVREHSIAESAADDGKLGKVAYSSLAPEFADALKSARKGSVVKVTFGNAIQIFKVLGTGSVQKHYRLATLTYPVVASQATQRAVHNNASRFLVAAQGSVEKFEAAAAAESVLPTSMNVEQGSRNVPGLTNSLEVVVWANKAKVGEVSEIFKLDDSYVVAVVTAIDNEEYRPLKSVSAQIERTLLRNKKFEILKAKMQGATLEEIAANADSKVESFEDAKSSAYYVKGIGVEPRVLGAIAAVSAENTGKLLPIIEGTSGAYALVVDEVATTEAQSVDAERVKAQAEAEAMAARRAIWAVQEGVNVVDNTVGYF